MIELNLDELRKIIERRQAQLALEPEKLTYADLLYLKIRIMEV